jgi:hypothetical protein
MKVLSFIMAVFVMAVAVNAAPAPGFSYYFDVSINLISILQDG